MSHKILITISDGLKAMIDKYNQENPFEPLHISEIAQKAIYERLTKGSERDALNPLNEVTTDKPIERPFKVESEPSHKAPIPIHEHVHKLHSEPILEMQVPVKKEPETSHKAPIPIHEHVHKLHSEPILEMQVPVKKEPETSHKAPIPIHEHVHKLHSEPIKETEEQVCEADFLGKECDTIEKTGEEPIHGIQTYKGKKEPTLKQCEFCGKMFPAKTKRSVTCSPNCRKAKSREKGKEKAGKK